MLAAIALAWFGLGLAIGASVKRPDLRVFGFALAIATPAAATAIGALL